MTKLLQHLFIGATLLLLQNAIPSSAAKLQRLRKSGSTKRDSTTNNARPITTTTYNEATAAITSSRFSRFLTQINDKNDDNNNDNDTSSATTPNDIRALLSNKQKKKKQAQKQAAKNLQQRLNNIAKKKNRNKDKQAAQRKKKNARNNDNNMVQIVIVDNETGEEEIVTIESSEQEPQEVESSTPPVENEEDELVEEEQQIEGRSDASPAIQMPSNCFSVGDYESLHSDIAAIANSISDAQDRAHFFGAIVRLVAHDFMDADTSRNNVLGSDGCIEWDHPSNAGLNDVWCNNDERCPLKALYDTKYNHLSRADYWIAAANAVIHHTSDNALDLRHTFVWGRMDNNNCNGSGDRLPESSGCSQIERVLIQNMGLNWEDSVALLGAHTLGSGRSNRSGHHGAWVRSANEAQVCIHTCCCLLTPHLLIHLQ